ncbi:MFS transporter [Paraburkholderia sp. SIMBA_053]|uniref:MFS transporter n=1 Tax=Paraburkholderia sp. SIMBA_053 TaxID=3085794 RepID=UPI00397A783B
MLVSYLMIVLDISIVITALPKIETGLRFSHTGLSWVSNAYTLAFGGMLLLGARAGDIFGRRRMLMTGLTLFSFASLAIGVAQSPAWLISARAIQGIGASILAPSTLALLSVTFHDPRERTRALSYYGATAGVGSTIGLVLGGVFADWLSWRVGFFINLPIGLALMLGAKHYLPETVRHSGELDIVGAASSTIGMTLLVYGIVHSATYGWTDATTTASLVASVALLSFFVINEWRAKQPILPLRLFASLERSVAYGTRMLFVGASVGFYFFATQYLQGVLDYTPLEAGVAFLPTTIANFAAAMSIPWLTRRLGNGGLLALALLLSVIGMVMLSDASAHTSYWFHVALPMALIGAGQGGTLSPLTVAGVANVDPKDAGAASGLVNVAHQLGGSLGLGILIVAFDAAGASIHSDAKTLLAARVSAAFTAAAVMQILALLLVLLLVYQFRRDAVSRRLTSTST